MSATAVRDRLRDQPLPGEAEAAARSWPVVEAALAERGPAAGRGRLAGRPLRLALVAALLAAGLAVALSPAGAAVGDWIGDRFTAHDARSAPAFAALPPGRLRARDLAQRRLLPSGRTAARAGLEGSSRPGGRRTGCTS